MKLVENDERTTQEHDGNDENLQYIMTMLKNLEVMKCHGK